MKPRLIKICGLTDPINILNIMPLHPDMMGLIFYPGSKRFVADLQCLDFLNHLKKRPEMVGVFVDPDKEAIQHVTNRLKLDAIQLHGSESPEMCRELRRAGFIVIKAFGIQPGFSFQTLDAYEGTTDYYLFDTAGPGYGGTGKQFNWNLLDSYNGLTPFILSGGLSTDNLAFPSHDQFIGIDLNSGFEVRPGIKDVTLIKGYLKKIRNDNDSVFPG